MYVHAKGGWILILYLFLNIKGFIAHPQKELSSLSMEPAPHKHIFQLVFHRLGQLLCTKRKRRAFDACTRGGKGARYKEAARVGTYCFIEHAGPRGLSARSQCAHSTANTGTMGKPRRRAPRDRSEDGGSANVSGREDNSSTGNAEEVRLGRYDVIPRFPYSKSEPQQ